MNMNNNNDSNNLLSFLKKQSLFNNSPTKRRSSHSRSKERNIQIKPATIKATYQDEGTRDIINQLSSKNGEYLPQTRQYSPIHNSPIQDKGLKYAVGETRKTRNTQESFQIKDQIKDNFWPQLVSYSTSFQSARIEATKSLQKMGNKLQNQITSINLKLQKFNAHMQKALAVEINNLRQKILHIVNEVFKESQKTMQEYLKFQEEKLCKDLIVMKDFLQKQYDSIESMKEEIGKPDWRKVTGKIIANEVERKVDQVVRKCIGLDVGRWDPGELIGYRIKDFQRDLRDALHLGRLK